MTLKQSMRNQHLYYSIGTIQFNMTLKQRVECIAAINGIGTIQFNMTLKPQIVAFFESLR